jgi:hypothetical protein
MSITRWPFSASSALVGSSAKISVGDLAKARAGHALLLAAGQLRRAHVAAVAEAHFFQRLARQRFAFAIAHAAVAQRQLHLLQRGQCREQVEALEHETDMVQAEALHLAAGHVAHVLAQRVHAATIGRGQAGQQRQQRALAATRRARYQGQLARDRCPATGRAAPAPARRRT